MKKNYLKAAGVWLALLTMASATEVHANCSNRHSDCRHHSERHPQLDQNILSLYNRSETASTLYTERLGLTILWSARPYGDSIALIDAYNDYIQLNAAAIQNVFAQLGGRADGVGSALTNLATTAQALVQGTATPLDLQIAATALSNALSFVSPCIDPNYVTGLIKSILQDVQNFASFAATGQFFAAEANCVQAIIAMNTLVAYIDSELTGIRFPTGSSGQ